MYIHRGSISPHDVYVDYLHTKKEKRLLHRSGEEEQTRRPTLTDWLPRGVLVDRCGNSSSATKSSILRRGETACSRINPCAPIVEPFCARGVVMNNILTVPHTLYFRKQDNFHIHMYVV